MQRQLIELRLHFTSGPRQETCAHPIGDRAEPEIKARRLHLALGRRLRQFDLAGRDHARDRL